MAIIKIIIFNMNILVGRFNLDLVQIWIVIIAKVGIPNILLLFCLECCLLVLALCWFVCCNLLLYSYSLYNASSSGITWSSSQSPMGTKGPAESEEPARSVHTHINQNVRYAKDDIVFQCNSCLDCLMCYAFFLQGACVFKLWSLMAWAWPCSQQASSSWRAQIAPVAQLAKLAQLANLAQLARWARAAAAVRLGNAQEALLDACPYIKL